MGWYGQHGTGSHVEMHEHLQTWTNSAGDTISYTDCKLVGFATHWFVMRINGEPKAICLDMIQRYPASGEWLYKPQDETMGPVDKNCPLSLLDLVPDPCSGYSTEWRNEVRAYHAAHKGVGRIKIGDTITLKEGYSIKVPGTVVEMRKRTPLVSFPGYGRYLVKRTQIGAVA